MRFRRPLVFVLCLMVALAVAASPASAQTRALEKRLVPHYASSGALDNLASTPAVVYSTVLEADAPWLQVTFRRAVLDPASQLRLTSLLDGSTQHLSPVHLQQWQNTSAYFNGGAVLVELIAGPGTTGQLVEIGDLWAGLEPTEPFTQCGPTDDREPSDFPERARLVSIGCTAWMYNESSCFASAGHCVQSAGGLGVVQFNVPPSNPNGSLNHPGPEDQYAVNTATRVFTNGGVGNDWGLFEVFPNSETGLLPFDVQGAFLDIASSLPPVNDTISVVGYGVDRNELERNQTQQFSDGPLVSATQTTLRYRADTEGGNSGSGVVWEATGEAVAIHTHGGCTVGGGSNAGTAVTHPGLQDALATFCQASTLQISISGSCPGPVTVSVSGAPANTEVGILSAANNNGFTKGGGLCSGTLFEAGEPFSLPPTFVIVDGNGNGSGNLTLDDDRCWVEAIALNNCDTSGATLVP